MPPGRFGLQFGSSEFEMEARPTIQQIMETSLRAVILTTQVRGAAGAPGSPLTRGGARRDRSGTVPVLSAPQRVM